MKSKTELDSDGKNKLYALKRYQYKASSEEREHIRHEAGLMKWLNIDEIVKCKEAFVSVKSCAIILELMHYTDINNIVEHGNYGEKFCQHILLAVTTALFKMHQKNVLHRDVKTENILVNDSFVVKLCDLGVSKSLS